MAIASSLPTRRRFGDNGRRRFETSTAKIMAYLIIGFLIGSFGGYVFMGTSHAILEVHTNNPNSHKSTDKTQPTTTTTAQANDDDRIHILCTSNGSPYQNYQTRILYATWQLIQDMAGGDKMVAFTRILHRSRDDFLSDTIPTFRVDPLHPKCDDWCEYPVTDRGNAVRVFLDAAKKDSSLIKAPWIYMVESDYVFMKPLVVPNPAAPRGTAWGSPFGYIVPTAVPAMMRKMYPESAGPVSDIPGTGPAPILMHREDWETVTPDWERLAAVIENDKEMVDRLAWVREMYGFSVALALNKVKIDLTSPPDNIFISQLPPDKILGKAQSYHYTLCTWYKTMDTNEDVWSYDKRFYTSERNATNVPLIQLPPPYPGDGKWKFLEGMPVTKVEYDSVLEMIQQMNLAIEKLEPMA